MWRSRARVFLLRSPLWQRPSPLQNQIPSKNLTVKPTPSRLRASSKWVPSAAAHFQSCRFFSADQSAGESVSGADGGKDPSFGSVESRASLAFDENSRSVSSESDDWSTGFGEGSSKDDVFGESLDPVPEAAGDILGVFGDGGEQGEIELETQDSVPGENIDSSLTAVDDGAEEDKIGGQSQDSPRGENDCVEDPMVTFVSEESVDEAAVEVPEIDIEKLENALSVLQSVLDDPMESRLDKMDLILSEEFVARVLQTPLILGEKLIGFFRWASKKPDFVKTAIVLGLLVRAVSSSSELSKKEAYMLWDLVKEIGQAEKELLNTEILNQLISLFWDLEKAKAGFEVFNHFDKFDCKPDADTYYLTIEALGKRSMFDTAWSVCERMLTSGSLPDPEKIGKIIRFFCKGKKAKDAHLVYLMAKENEKYPPRSSVDFLIGGLSRNDDTVRIALELLEDYSKESRKYAIKAFTSVITGLCTIKDVEEAKKLLYRMIDSGPPPGNAVFNYVITALSKVGEMDDAIALLKVMEGRGLRPDIYTYTVVMSGFAKGGLMDEARKIFYEAKKRHPKLSPATYHVLTRGYCTIEEFENALKCMSEMKEDGMQPNSDEYDKLIQSLCLKALNWRAAEKLLQEMKESGLHLKGTTRSLIAAVRELEEGELQAEVAVES